MNDLASCTPSSPEAPLSYGIVAPVAIIVNERSGHLQKDLAVVKLTDELDRRGLAYEVLRPDQHTTLATLASRAAAQPFRTIIAIGGDGTITTVAQHLVGRDQVLGVIPMGTFNYFARNLGLHGSVEESVEALFASPVIRIGVGMVNDRLFLNNSALGLYPAILLDRETQQKRLGRSRISAVLAAVHTALRQHPMLKIVLEPGERLLRTPLVYLCINPYQLEHLRLPGSTCVDTGQLAILVTHNLRRLGLLRLAVQLLLGIRDETSLEVLCLDNVKIHTRRNHLSVALDGEVVRLRAPLHYRYVPAALQVLAPAAFRTPEGDARE